MQQFLANQQNNIIINFHLQTSPSIYIFFFFCEPKVFPSKSQELILPNTDIHLRCYISKHMLCLQRQNSSVHVLGTWLYQAFHTPYMFHLYIYIYRQCYKNWFLIAILAATSKSFFGVCATEIVRASVTFIDNFSQYQRTQQQNYDHNHNLKPCLYILEGRKNDHV